MPDIRLKSTVPVRKFMILTIVAALIGGALAILLSMIFLPVAAAALALLYLYEPGGRRIAFYTVGGALVVGSIPLGLRSVFVAVALCIVAFLIAASYAGRWIKYVTVFYTTFLLGITAGAVLYFAGAAVAGEYSLGAVMEAYHTQFRGAVEETLSTYLARLQSMVNGSSAQIPTLSEALEVFETYYTVAVQLLISVLLVFGFLLSGIAFKCFAAVGRRLDADPSFFDAWHFAIPSLYAWVYVILFAASIFMPVAGNSFFAILSNLRLVFLTVFAYIGAKCLLLSLRASRVRALPIILGVLLLLFVPYVAIQLLSLQGAFVIIVGSRFHRRGGDGTDGEA